MPSKKSIFAVIIVVVILLGLGVYGYELMTVAGSVSVKASVKSVSVEGFNPPFDFYPDAIHLTIRLDINNPSSFSAEIDRVIYKVYIEDHFLGEGIKENIYIPANTELPLDIDFTARTSDILNIIADQLKRGDNAIDYRVEILATIPIKLFGVVRVFSIDIPYTKKGYYIIPVPGMKPQVKGVNAYWNTQVAYVGFNVTLTVEIPAGLKGDLEVVIMKDLTLLPDKVAYTFDIGYVQGPKTITLVFTPTEASSLTLRGYYIKVILNGQEIYVQRDGYPPRLKVHP